MSIDYAFRDDGIKVGFYVKDRPAGIDLSWKENGICYGTFVISFFPPRGDSRHTRWAKSRCAECQVQAECLNWATWEELQSDGIFGGANTRQRTYLRTGRLTTADIRRDLDTRYARGKPRHLTWKEVP